MTVLRPTKATTPHTNSASAGSVVTPGIVTAASNLLPSVLAVASKMMMTALTYQDSHW